MNVLGTQVEAQSVNVLPLFNSIQVPPVVESDPMEELLSEAQLNSTLEDETLELGPVARKQVSEDQHPDQSMFILQDQLSGLKENLQRLKFYLGDLDDLITK